MKKTVLKSAMVLLALFFVFGISEANIDKVYAKDAEGDYVVVVDPGHGGGDSGAVSSHTGDYEKNLNWNIALALKAELETYEGVKVYLTKGSSEYHSNGGRAQVGQSMKADLNVSIHNNSATSTSANGVVAYGTVDSRFKDKIKNLCVAVSKEVQSSVGVKLYNGGYGARSSGMGTGYDYYTFLFQSSYYSIPSMIIEHCYMSNSSDAKIVHSYENQCKMGAADATAIAKYFGLSKRTVAGGSDIVLTRTYSAYMTTAKEGIYSTSDESVVAVRKDGLITAKKAGTAVVTCTATDGTIETVNVTVPQVKLVGIAAGLVQDGFSSKTSFKKAGVIVKAIYSDGSAVQVSKDSCAYGSVQVLKTYTYGSNSEKQMSICGVSVSYNGFSCVMPFYYYSDPSGVSSHSASLTKVGTNTDILVVPGVYKSNNTTVETPTQSPTQAPMQAPTQVPTQAVTQKPTQAPTQEQSTQVNYSVYESEGYADGGTQEESATVSQEKESGATTENAEQVDNTDGHKSGPDVFLIVCIVLLVVLVMALVLIGYIYIVRRKGA